MIWLLKAALDKDQKCKCKEKDSVCTLFFNPENTTTAELKDALFSNIKKYKKLDVDCQSFLDIGFKNIKTNEILLVLNSVISHYQNFPINFKKNNKNNDKKITLINQTNESNPEIDSLIKAQNVCKELQELPPNLLNPEIFVEKMKKLLECSCVEIELICGCRMQEKNLNLIYEVGKASKSSKYLVILKHMKGGNGPTTALIGKGVCYDSGGLNIKTGNYMSTMKFDMSGAAVALSTMFALSKNKVEKNVVVLLPLVENLINCNAYKADDVIISHSGLSVEITNTDAEGRLILADAISYAARELKVSKIITIATLTGAIGYALGNKYAGVWTTEEEDWNNLYTTSNKCGDYIWRMPLNNCYLKGLRSCIADIANSSKTGAGGASRAAMFLKEFTNDLPFIHIDIANVAHLENENIATAPLLTTLYYLLKNH